MATGGNISETLIGTSSNADPTLILPASEQVTTGSTTDISGVSYTDSFATGNPGDLYLQISDDVGTLSATDSAGTVSGSGTNSIVLSAPYADIVDALGSLTYTAPASTGTDAISFDIWDQAGTQTTGSIPVGIAAPGGGATETWSGAVSSDWNVAGNWSAGAVPSAGDTAVIAGSTANYPILANTTLNNETIIVDQAAPLQGNTLDLDGVTLGAGSILEIQNPSGNAQDIATINLGGTVTVDAGATIVANGSVAQGLTPAGANAVLVNNGTIDNTEVTFANGGTVINNGVFENQTISAATLINTGTLLADSAYVSVSGTVLGGTAEAANGVGVSVDGTLSGTAVDFNGAGELILNEPMALTNGTALNNFGPGDEILLSGSAFVPGTTLAFSNDTLAVQQTGTTVQTILFNGNYTLGNFVIELGSGDTPYVFDYAASGEYSGGLLGYGPDIAAPAEATVAQGGTLSLGGVTVQNGSNFDTTLQISATSGTLSMNGATGSGTDSLSITASGSQVNADLASLTYTPAAGTSSDAVQVIAQIDYPSAIGITERFVPISVNAGSGPTLTEPSSESVAPSSAVAVSGSYSDPFAASNPGAMFLQISDNSGTLTAHYPIAGTPDTGTIIGTSNTPLTFQGSYDDVQDILASLIYTAGAIPGSDTISFDIWNQAGAETTGSVPVTITGPGNGQTEVWTGAVNSDWNTPGNWSYGAVPGTGQTAVIPADTANNATLSNSVLTGETITLEGSVSVPAVNFTNVTLGAGSLLDGTGGQIYLNGTLTIASGATYAPGSVSMFRAEASSATTVVNDGVIADSTGLDGLGDDVVNNGTIYGTGGSIQIGTLVNNGVALIYGGGLEVDGTIVGGTIDLSGGGALQLTAPMALTGSATVDGFSQGSRILVFQTIDSLAFNDHILDISNAGTLVEAIRLGGNLGLGNFEVEHSINVPFSEDSSVAFAASGEPSGVFQSPYVADISAPAVGTVAAGGTLALGSVAISSAGTMTLNISASSGTLYMDGASGNGTDDLSISAETSQSQINADLASLVYVAAAGPTSLQEIEITADVPASTSGTNETSRYIDVTVAGSSGGSGPALTEPSSETVAAGGSVAVSGSYSDSFAQSNPGAMYVEAIATGGTLYATGASGNAAPGSGSSSIEWSTDYNDVNAVLNSLTFAAGDTAGSGSIYFEVWNQAGVESSDTVPVTITGGTGGGATIAWTGAANDGEWNTASNWSNNTVPTSGDTVLISPSGVTGPSLSNATLTGETIILGSASQTGPSVFFNDVTLGAGTTLESAGSGGSIGDIGTLTVASGAAIAADGAPLGISSDSSSPATVFNDGTIINTGSALVALDDVVENNGVIIDSNPGSMSIGDRYSIINTGTIVDAGGNVELNGAVQGGTVAFVGSGGTLDLGVFNPFAQGAVVSGFGTGDRMVLGAFNPNAMSFSGGTLALSGGSFGEAIPFTGSLGLDNFELNSTVTGANGTPTTTLLYAPSGGPGGTASGEPDITAAGTATVAQSGTLALSGVSISNVGTVTLNITSTSGTLDMTGANGNGTDHLTVTGLSENQVNSELASLTYMPSAGTSSDTIEISASSPFSVTGTTDTIRYIPVSITGGNGGPSLHEQSAETVASSSTTAIGGSYVDSFAQGNPGDLYLGISDSVGTLTATDASGNAVAGSGTNNISLSTDYVDLNAILSSLHYTAGSNLGTDTISFDVWNQAGVETVGTTDVTIGQISGGTMTAADFSPGPSGSALSPDGNSSSSGSYPMSDTGNQPVGMPIVLHPAS